MHAADKQVNIREDFFDVVRADVAELVPRRGQLSCLRQRIVSVPKPLHIVKICRPLRPPNDITFLPFAVFDFANFRPGGTCAGSGVALQLTADELIQRDGSGGIFSGDEVSDDSFGSADITSVYLSATQPFCCVALILL